MATNIPKARAAADKVRREIVADLVADRAQLEQRVLDVLQVLTDSVVAAAVKANVDVSALMKQTLADRGLDVDAQWIGFPEAERRYGGAR